MVFYKGCLGGELKFMTVAESPMVKDMPSEKHGLVMHSTLTSGDTVLIGMDMMRDAVVVGDNVGLAFDCDSKKELDDLFSSLAAEGEVFMEPEDAFWGGYFAVVTDKYGVEWMLNHQKTSITS